MNNQPLMSNSNAQIFQQNIGKLNDTILSQLVTQARNQGIAENQIQQGLKIINQMKNGGKYL